MSRAAPSAHCPSLLPLLIVAAALLTLPGTSAGQCILANPSFEVAGSGGNVFGGWNQFGDVGSTSLASHGSVAARVSGPDYGGWDVSGYWQQLDSASGQRWEVTGKVAHSSSSPLTGDCLAIVNIEWWDASSMMDYESHSVALPSTQTDEYQEFSFVTDAAPSGTQSIHALFAVLQSPDDPPPDVCYDQVTVFSATYPTMADLQWNDFPGGRQISFSGRNWRVKGPGYYGPGPNSFSDSQSSVWVDLDDRLHMTVRYSGGTWYSSEIALVETLGYGDYIFTTEGRLDQLDPAVVLGLYIWQYGPCYDDAYLWWNPYNEFDIEFSYWGDPSSDLGQFVAQPWNWYGNLSSFDYTFSEGEVTSHAFRWLPDRVECRSWRGGPVDEAPENMIYTWTYAGPHIPRPEIPRTHINLWRCCDGPASYQEVVIDAFTFFPAGETGVDEGDDEHTALSKGRLMPARPNPFNPITTLGYSLRESAHAEIAIFDLSGRRVKTLVDRWIPAGDHEVTWNGLHDRGTPVASGVYFCRLALGESVETRRMVLVR